MILNELCNSIIKNGHFKLCDRYSIPAAGFLIIISPQSHVRRVLPVWLYSTQHMQGGQITIMTRSYYRSELLPDECLQSCWMIVHCIWKCWNPHVYSLFKQYHYNSRIIFHANTKWVTCKSSLFDSPWQYLSFNTLILICNTNWTGFARVNCSTLQKN